MFYIMHCIILHLKLAEKVTFKFGSYSVNFHLFVDFTLLLVQYKLHIKCSKQRTRTGQKAPHSL